METNAERAAKLHDELQQYLLLTHPFTSVEVIISALTFEIGRIVALQKPTDDEIDVVVAGVADTMKLQIRAHREGRLKP